MTSKKESEVREIFDKLFKYIPDKKEEDNLNFNSDIFLKDYADIIKEVKCPICLQVSLESEQCSKCQAIFCKKCNKEKNCPTCKELYVPNKIDKILFNVMGHLLMKCKNCEKIGKKQTIVKLSKIKEHLIKCEYSSYQCLQCDKKIFNSKHHCIKHSYECGYSNKNCFYCKRIIKAYLKKSHEEECANEKIECDKCKTKIERKNLENHKIKECAFREVKCEECHEKYIYNEGHTKEKCLQN